MMIRLREESCSKKIHQLPTRRRYAVSIVRNNLVSPEKRLVRMAENASSMLARSARDGPPRSRAAALVIANSHVMPPLIERNKFAPLIGVPAFSDRYLVAKGW